MFLKILRPVLLSLGVVLGIILSTSLYAYLFTEQPHKNIVLLVFLVSLTAFLSVVFFVKKIKPSSEYESNESIVRIFEFLFVLNSSPASNKYFSVLEFEGRHIEFLVYFLPLILCVFIGLLSFEILAVENALVNLFSFIGDFWRSTYYVDFPEYRNTLLIYNSLLLIFSIPQAIFLVRYKAKSKSYLSLFFLRDKGFLSNRKSGVKSLGGAFIVVVIVGFLYQSSAVIVFLNNFKDSYKILQSAGIWPLFFISSLGHFLFISYLSSWLAFRRDLLLANYSRA